MKRGLLKNCGFSSLIFFSLIGVSCVSVKLPSGGGTPSKNVNYEIPGKPFQEIKNAAADKAWISDNTGNTISYLSDCNSSSDPTLVQLESETLGVLNKLTIINTKNIEYNGRDARTTIAEGEVDGVPVKTEVLIFKKNGCNFTLSYGGVLKRFDKERSFYENFIKTFRAQ